LHLLPVSTPIVFYLIIASKKRLEAIASFLAFTFQFSWRFLGGEDIQSWDQRMGLWE
jgi:hypothetical protein